MSSLRPAYYPTERAARAFADTYERPTTAGATVYRVKRFGPGETGDGFASGRRSSESASRSSFSRRPSTARLSESSASLAAYVKLARDDDVELDARAKRQVHVAVSERAYTSHTARPTTAPASRNDGGFARNKTSHAARAGRSSSGLRGEWRGAHFAASAKDAVVVAEVDADVSRGGGGSGGGVGRYGIARALRDASESHKGDSTRCRSLGGLTGGAPREREPARGTFRARGGETAAVERVRARGDDRGGGAVDDAADERVRPPRRRRRRDDAALDDARVGVDVDVDARRRERPRRRRPPRGRRPSRDAHGHAE